MRGCGSPTAAVRAAEMGGIGRMSDQRAGGPDGVCAPGVAP